MLDFLFILKTFAATILIIFLMQIEVDGSYTLEDKAMSLLQDSAVVQPLRKVANGAVKATSDGYDFIRGQFKQGVRSVADSATKDDSKSKK